MLPRWARTFFSRISDEGERFSIQGDFEEEFRTIRDRRGLAAAKRWCWSQILRSLPAFVKRNVLGEFQMFKNYLKIAARNFRRHFGYSALNVAGMAVGLASCILIFLWVQEAMSFNRYHEKAKRLYRVYSEIGFSDGRKIVMGENSYNPLARLLKTSLPEVAEATRIAGSSGILFKAGGREYPGQIGGFVDASYFRMFTHRFLDGDPGTALNDLYSCVLTRETARKIFGNENPIGRTLNVRGEYDVKVTGVIEDIPRQSDYRAHAFFPFRLFWGPAWTDGDGRENWGGNPLETHVLLHPGVRPSALEKKLSSAVQPFLGSDRGVRVRLGLQPLSRIHIENPEGGGLIRYVPIFSTIALIVLLIACFNFVNMTTARSGNRAREVALRKTIGARRSELVGQFFSESILTAFLALLLALGLTALLLPAFSKLVGAAVTWNVVLNGASWLRLAAIVLVVGLIAGGYPALFLSAFRPAQVMRETRALGARGSAFRKILVVLQFSLSVALIIAALGVSRQVRFLRGRNVGFDRDNVVGLTLAGDRVRQYEVFKSELLRNPGVLGVTRSAENPSWINSSVWNAEWEGKSPAETVAMHFMYVDYDFFETFQMPIAAGRSFSRDFASDEKEGYVVNEAALRAMGLLNPVGKRISVFRDPGTIVGVAKDFHFQPLNFPVRPMVIGMNPNWTKRNVFVRLSPVRRAAALKAVEEVWKKTFPGALFFAQEFASRYRSFYVAEERIEKVVGVFSVLAILVSCLGLFGLASFLAEQRTREVGIRKVLGATTGRISLLLTKEFVKAVAAAVFIAWPLAYFALRIWLREYAARIKPSLAIFLLAGAAALVIAVATVAFQAVRAALRNPAEAVRHE